MDHRSPAFRACLGGPVKNQLLLLVTIRGVADTQCLGRCHSLWPKFSPCLKGSIPRCPLCQDPAPEGYIESSLSAWLGTSASMSYLLWWPCPGFCFPQTLSAHGRKQCVWTVTIPLPLPSSHTECLLFLHLGDIPFTRSRHFLPLPTWWCGTQVRTCV